MLLLSFLGQVFVLQEVEMKTKRLIILLRCHMTNISLINKKYIFFRMKLHVPSGQSLQSPYLLFEVKFTFSLLWGFLRDQKCKQIETKTKRLISRIFLVSIRFSFFGNFRKPQITSDNNNLINLKKKFGNLQNKNCGKLSKQAFHKMNNLS